MKKLLLYILFSTVNFFGVHILSFAQPQKLSEVTLDSIYLAKPDELQFTLRLERVSDSWKYWANGTFQFAFDSAGYDVSPNRHTIELVPGSSNLNIIPIPGVLPTVSYIVTPNVLQGRFSITVAGPEKFEDCIVPPLDTQGITIGKFIIRTTDGSVLPGKLRWLEPFIYYQANAYKIDHDSLLTPSVVFATTNDNLEMDDGLNVFVGYETREFPGLRTIVKNFNAEYIGLKRILLTWETLSEAYVDGFIVVRGLRTSSVSEPELVYYKDTIADYRRTDPKSAGLVGLGTSPVGREYTVDHDTIEYRGLEYCYKLLYRDFSGNLITAAYDCERIPNSIITRATPSPNPFNSKTNIKYIVEDDVMLDVFVSDLTGRILFYLKKGEYVVRGPHNDVDFVADYNAQEGLYNVIFIAYPIDDPTVELSRAIVKLQLIR